LKRPQINFIIDSIALSAFVFLTTTGILMRYILPPGSGHFTTIWGLDRHQWGTIHFWLSIVLFGVLALHLILHWKWIVCVLTGKPRQESGYRAVLGFTSLIIVLALSISPLVQEKEVSSINQTRGLPNNNSEVKKDSIFAKPEAAQKIILPAHEYEDLLVKGSMTLNEAANSSGVPLKYLLKELNLPSSLTGNERLGQLKRQFGFELNRVREIILKYKESQQ
jgi:Domain of unknown function (DUF4405)